MVHYQKHVVLVQEKAYYSIDRPRRERTLPNVLSKEEVGAMLSATKNPKHKCIIALIYSCGLRRGELINLKLEDVDSKRMLIKIRGAKGKKDRYVQLASSLLPLLRNYYKELKPTKWFSEGRKGDQYTPTTVLRLVKHSAKPAGIKKRVYLHILRHSYATHNLEQWIDIRYIQEWMGHGSIKTTQRYTQVSKNNFNFKNPIDDIID